MQPSTKQRQPGTKLWLSFSLGIIISVTSGCGLQNADPDKLFDNAVSGLSGKDNFSFAGTTQYALNGMPSQQGVSFKGMVTNHNQLMMQVIPENEAAANINAKQSLTVVPSGGQTTPYISVLFNRSHNEWIVTESSASGDQADQLIRWNPMAHLERLNIMHKGILAVKEPLAPGMTMLEIVPDQAEVSEMVRTELSEQIELLEPARKLKELQNKLQLSDNEIHTMQDEVKKRLSEARSRMEEMRSSLNAESTYLIGVDRQSNLPRTMQVRTITHYNVGGQSKEETTQVSYSFIDSQ